LASQNRRPTHERIPESAVAIAFAAKAPVFSSTTLSEEEYARDTAKLVEEAGQKAVLLAGDAQDAKHCRAIIDKANSDLGGIDILVNNAAHQATFKEIEDVSDDEWNLIFRVNDHAIFYLTKAAVPHIRRRTLEGSRRGG
jgi:NAD(P)-dependent dehydrogenase (short-subunit alcohol dehydrogenase family)